MNSKECSSSSESPKNRGNNEEGTMNTKRQRIPLKAASKIMGVLHHLQEDVIHPQDSKEVKRDNPVNEVTTGLQNVYVQCPGGKFRLAPKELAAHATLDNTKEIRLEPVPQTQFNTALDVAIFMQKAWTCLSNICFGILAGIGVYQLAIVYCLRISWEQSDLALFIKTYSSFAHVVPISFYVLLAICLVSLCDWFDIAHTDARQIADTLSYRPSWLLLLLYFIILLVSIAEYKLDDYMALYTVDEQIAENSDGVSAIFTIWLVMDSIRCVLAILGWCAVAITRSDDLLLLHLYGLKKYEPPSNLQ